MRQTKSSLTRKLDRICSEIVRARGQCERCGSKNYLQCCHIFSRTYRSTRWDLDNLMCMCAKCHFWAHKNPIGFVEFVQSILKDRYEILKEKFREITKHTEEDLQIKLNTLREMKEDND